MKEFTTDSVVRKSKSYYNTFILTQEVCSVYYFLQTNLYGHHSSLLLGPSGTCKTWLMREFSNFDMGNDF